MILSPHFRGEEFACKDGTLYPYNQADKDDPDKRTWLTTRLTPLVQTLEVIRQAAGNRPLIIDSGYRTLAYDQKLYDADKGAGHVAKPQDSQHPKGRAADIRHGKLKPAEMFNLVLESYHAGKLPDLGGIGLYATFIHVDVRSRPGSFGGANDGHLAIWGGTRPSNIV